MANKKYYDIKNLLSTNSAYLMLLGQRSNGKSYQVKYTCVSDAYNDKGLMIYLRRWASDIKQKEVSTYFDDVPVKDITNGEYIGITAYQGEIFFYNLNEDKEIVRGKLVGRYCDLYLSFKFNAQYRPTNLPLTISLSSLRL